MRRDDQKCYVSKIAKIILKTKKHIISGQCIINDNGAMAVNHEDSKMVWKS